MKIIADNTIPFLNGVIESAADVEYAEAKHFTPEIVRNADCLIVRSIDKCTSELLKGSSVKLITTATIGFDHIDTDYCEANGITWRNAPGCNARSVGQYVLSSLLSVFSKRGETISGKTIGIIGVGHVGKEVERLCSACGMRVLRNDPPREAAEGSEGFVSLETIAKEADVITIHTPLTKTGDYKTHHLANARFFEQLERRPIYINAARGPIHDTEALIEAKKSGKLSELIIDCWENEPTINQKLLGMATLATPHIAGFSADGKRKATEMCLENIEKFFGIKFDRSRQTPLPSPRHEYISIHTDGEKTGIKEAVLTSFDPTTLTCRLKNNPNDFEYMRNNYDNPREYEAYTVCDADNEEKATLASLGFKIRE
jgi:erythronate-4-phosphate dehydrogenase